MIYAPSLPRLTASVAEIEATSEVCLAFFRIMETPDDTLPDRGVLSFERLRRYG